MPSAPRHGSLEIRLRPRGVARFFSAAFLSVWLCAWSVGELGAFWLLNHGLVELLTGTPPGPGGELELGSALGMGLFLLVWLAFWTLGGIAALRELLGALWGEDRLAVENGRLVVQSAIGPFRSTREFERASIHRIGLSQHRATLTLWTHETSAALSSLGTREERDAAVSQLREALALGEPGEEAALPSLPDVFEETLTAEGARALVPARRRRRLQATLASIGTLLLCGLALMIEMDSYPRDEKLSVAILLLAMTGLAGYGSLWLARGRMEWVIGSGRLELQRRFGSRCRCVFEASKLELTVSTDSDGDARFKLEAVSDSDRSGASRGKPRRRTILSTLRDPTDPRQLGAWLARATGMPFDDNSTEAAEPVSLAEWKAQLEQAGSIGRWLARWMP